MEVDRKRFAHYVPAALVDEFNQRADEQEPALQRQVYFEHIIELGLIADIVLDPLVEAADAAKYVLERTEPSPTILWKELATKARVLCSNAVNNARKLGVE